MICYQCGQRIPDEEPHYNGYEKTVCKPCFSDATRCFVCRFPGKQMQTVEGLGPECEFCRREQADILREGMDLTAQLAPLQAFLQRFEVQAPPMPQFVWADRLELRTLQTDADLPPEDFIDDFLRYCYPVWYLDGQFHLLKRIARPTFIVHATVQLAVAHYARRFKLPNLAGNSPFHTLARGWCHWLGYTVAGLLQFEQLQRELRRWPELGAQGEFQRWEAMARHRKPPQMVAFFKANLGALAKKHLQSP